MARFKRVVTVTSGAHGKSSKRRSERGELCDGVTRPSSAGQPERSEGRCIEALPAARLRLCTRQCSRPAPCRVELFERQHQSFTERCGSPIQRFQRRPVGRIFEALGRRP